MHYDVPAYSQYLDVNDTSWRSRSCGIVALKMILDYWEKKKKSTSSSADDLIRQGVARDGFVPGIGWRHKSLAELASLAGLVSINFDWSSNTALDAFSKLTAHLEHAPLIASVHKDFEPGKSGHLIVITGFENKNIFANDPVGKNRNELQKEIDFDRFLVGWKRRIIVAYPPTA